jgi:hypothetical protein
VNGSPRRPTVISPWAGPPGPNGPSAIAATPTPSEFASPSLPAARAARSASSSRCSKPFSEPTRTDSESGSSTVDLALNRPQSARTASTAVRSASLSRAGRSRLDANDCPIRRIASCSLARSCASSATRCPSWSCAKAHPEPCRHEPIDAFSVNRRPTRRQTPRPERATDRPRPTGRARSGAKLSPTARHLPPHGAIAQLGERLDRTQEVGGSSPPSSTTKSLAFAGLSFWLIWLSVILGATSLRLWTTSVDHGALQHSRRRRFRHREGTTRSSIATSFRVCRSERRRSPRRSPGGRQTPGESACG